MDCLVVFGSGLLCVQTSCSEPHCGNFAAKQNPSGQIWQRDRYKGISWPKSVSHILYIVFLRLDFNCFFEFYFESENQVRYQDWKVLNDQVLFLLLVVGYLALQ